MALRYARMSPPGGWEILDLMSCSDDALIHTEEIPWWLTIKLRQLDQLHYVDSTFPRLTF